MHLLIVDDEPIIRLGLEKMARAYTPPFADIRTADNGLDAMDKIREFEPSVVLTDIRMPKMDGLALCRTISKEYTHIQMIVVSGYSDFEYAQKCMASGVKHYLLKPVAESDLYEVLDSVVKREAPGYIPVTRYVEWIDRMEQCIWSLQSDELNGLIEQWREYCLKANLSASQLEELLDECMGMLLKRFEARHYTPEQPFSVFPTGNVKAQLDVFDARLRTIARDLCTRRKGNYKDPMEEARAFIDSRLSQEVSLDEVAQMVGLAPTYFSLLFKKMTNETFVQYRIKKRMEKAKSLLAVPHYKIADIASEVGYDDYSHFTKTFKKIVGITPSEYRSLLGIK